MSLPWFRMYPSDFLGDAQVQLMPAQARLGYLWLLLMAWQMGPLEDPGAILEAIGLPGELWTHISPCWTNTPQGWVQKRLEKERESATKRHQDACAASAARESKRVKRLEGDRPIIPRSSVDHPSIIPRSSNQSQNQSQNQNQPREKGRARYDKKQVRQEVVLAAFDSHALLKTVPGLRVAVERWFLALKDRKKLWASLGALERHFALMESRPAEACEAVSLAADNCWTGLNHAYRELDRDKPHARHKSNIRPDGTRPGEFAEPSRIIRKI